MKTETDKSNATCKLSVGKGSEPTGTMRGASSMKYPKAKTTKGKGK